MSDFGAAPSRVHKTIMNGCRYVLTIEKKAHKIGKYFFFF